MLKENIRFYCPTKLKLRLNGTVCVLLSNSVRAQVESIRFLKQCITIGKMHTCMMSLDLAHDITRLSQYTAAVHKYTDLSQIENTMLCNLL